MIRNFDFIKHCILYADDDPDDLMLVKDTFEKYAENIELVTAYDGVEAIRYLKSLSPIEPAPCLIILDINMPRMSGKEALKELRSMDRFKHPRRPLPHPLFLMTGSLPQNIMPVLLQSR